MAAQPMLSNNRPDSDSFPASEYIYFGREWCETRAVPTTIIKDDEKFIKQALWGT